ncbi:MAG: D-amino acid aminotransferase [gamma proteobacterium symbiont of Bathyaustriella thionipta]|nr:D-amino acid aminotransferase [gamma proteobacterium symbiont of Bathyaustriella thionipta]MCU7948611.1 D-amino acid aminotransferase [gamma proteobacterium symbiont of Bathyaustriella thionipta]MCU7952884.1 D-amino acid aminotransferase [gamma proteobacterium symbiont of Bathyaustriella thionipta]MCU7955138.1 D-amino acid aminotransferase [gamma proteobacterium symbiont of Bathyaustriella thionipta]MCU7968874.1 D-amino acid aminotransferase [gamma proteobacterium symbiont of Bathyaustriella
MNEPTTKPNPDEPVVYLNGEYLALSQAHISVLDRGFTFGDGVYEVIPAYSKNLFRLQHHLQRLDASLTAVKIKNPLSAKQWQQSIEQLIDINAYNDQSIYLQVTRGVAPRDHRFPHQKNPTVFMMTSPQEKPAAEISITGISAITLNDNRWKNCHIKTISLLANVLLRQEALDKGAEEAILLSDGYATEGAASNLFIVQNDCLITPPKSPLLLPGITRDLIVEIAQQQKFCLKEQTISETDLLNAQEIWVTSSTKEIAPVTKLNDKIISNGKPGPHWHKMMQAYQSYKHKLRTH